MIKVILKFFVFNCTLLILPIIVSILGTSKTTKASLIVDLTKTQKANHEEVMEFNRAARVSDDLRYSQNVEYRDKRDVVAEKRFKDAATSQETFQQSLIGVLGQLIHKL
jgi:predicted HAD superfamily Cof-like phosphohydrolase